MAARWHFNQRTEGDNWSESMQGEFFSETAIDNPCDSLIREGTQNSMDAGNGAPVRVRIAWGESPAAQSAPFFESLWSHLEAEKNGLDPDQVPRRGDPCPYLIFEDFGTCGLTGDPAADRPPAGDAANHFFHFFRADGWSDKQGGNLGSWGLGKTVFLRASRINACFGLTLPRDAPRPLLMGRIQLRNHTIRSAGGGERDHRPHGLFGRPPTPGPNGLVHPMDDDQSIQAFRAAFGLSRHGEESGLSIIVPFVQPEVADGTKVLQAVLRHCYWPILRKRLVVEIGSGSEAITLDDQNMLDQVALLPDEQRKAMLPLARLADAARSGSVPIHDLAIPRPSTAYKWSEVDGEAEANKASLEDAKARIDADEPVAFRVPFTVRPKSGLAQDGEFLVFMQRVDADSRESWREPPAFVRGDITIPDAVTARPAGVTITSLRVPRICTIVAIGSRPEDPLALALRFAENPSHRAWSTDTKQGDKQFKNRFLYPKSMIEFPLRSAKAIYDLMHPATGEVDKSLFKDLLPAPRRPNKGTPPDGPPPPSEGTGLVSEEGAKSLDPSEDVVEIWDLKGGFAIVPGSRIGERKGAFEVLVAYDNGMPDPISKFKAFDFDFTEEAGVIIMKSEGAAVQIVEPNKLMIDPGGQSFRVEVRGFDPLRDIYVRCSEVER